MFGARCGRRCAATSAGMNMPYHLAVPVAQRKGRKANSFSMASATAEGVGGWTVPFMVIDGTVGLAHSRRSVGGVLRPEKVSYLGS